MNCKSCGMQWIISPVECNELEETFVYLIQIENEKRNWIVEINDNERSLVKFKCQSAFSASTGQPGVSMAVTHSKLSPWLSLTSWRLYCFKSCLNDVLQASDVQCGLNTYTVRANYLSTPTLNCSSIENSDLIVF